jgi:hypothetical protein
MGSSGGTGSQAQPESRTLVRVHMAPHSVIQQQAKRHHTAHLFTPHGSVDERARDIGRSKHFITMDLESGFWQVLIATKRCQRQNRIFRTRRPETLDSDARMGCLNGNTGRSAVLWRH